MRLLALVFFTAILAEPAAAQNLHVQGVTGYLDEYELSADLTGQRSDGGTEKLFGPLNVKHVGLCTHSGPNEVVGQLAIQFAGASHPVFATLTFDTHQCTYRGYLSESAVGTMTCAGTPSLPLRLWIK